MNRVFKRILTLLLFCIVICSHIQAYQAEPTTLIFVRHAERAEDGTRNPPISDEGKERAISLYYSLLDYSITEIYSTQYKRTMMTAKPTADSLGIKINEYGFDDLNNFLSSLIAKNAGNAVLIVGHSNTTPSLTNLVLGDKRFEKIDESKYGDMFIVTTSEFGKGEVTLKEF